MLTAGSVPTQYQQIDPGTGHVPQVVGGVGAPLGNIVLPMGGLYRLVGSNGASVNTLGRAANGLGGVKANNSAPGRRYLIETDPRFVDYNNLISSDYLLDKLGVDPQWTQTRLGDGFYEQRLVLDQITQLTGRRYLGNYADGVAQYRALLNGGVAEAGTLHLSVGVALTADQVAALTHDIVWMVEQEYQGQKVLVPVVYLSSKTALTLRSDGALLASDNGDVSLNATAGLSNTGTIGGANVSANVGNLLNQGRIVSSGTVALQANQDLLNLGGQIAGRDVLLSAGRDLTSTTRDALAGGDLRSGITAGNNLLLQAGRDLSLTGTTLQAGNNAALQAGNNLLLQPTALRDESGLMRGGDTSSLTVGGNLQLAAGNDLIIRQAQVKAGGDLMAAAGHDLDVTSVLGDSHTTTDETRQGKTKVVTASNIQVIDQQALTAGGNLVLSAGHDVNLTAAKLDAGKGLAVVAGNDLNSTTLTTVDTSTTVETRNRFKQTTRTRDETVHGTEFTAGGDIALQSGHDVNLTAAKAFTETGALAVSAGNDVNLLAAKEQHDAVQDMQKKKTGFLSSKTTTTHDEWHDSTAVATTLSGDTVQIAAGHDLLSQGAQVAGTGNVVVAAGNDLTLETAQNTHSEEHEKKTKKSGMFGSGGIGVTFGTQKIQNNADTSDVTHVGSTVGSVAGDVTLVAGNRYAQTGSDVLANAGDITVKAKDIAITEVHDTTDAEQRSKFSQGGLSITLSSAALNLAQSAYDTAKAGSKVSGDARMQALAAGSAAYSAYGAASSLSQTGSALASGSAASAAQGANISIAVTVGGSKSESKSTQSADQAKGSKLQAGGDVNLIATGGGDASNLLVRGSDVTAGHDLLLAADHDVTIEAAKNTAEQHSTSKSSSAAVGVAITYGTDGLAAGVTLSASGARGKANGEDVSYTNSHVAAGNNATIISGNDTTLKGGQVSADKVIADVGGNLNIESLQDSSSYASKDKSIGGNVTFGIGFSASASYSSNKVNGDYASVTEQSGIQAGKGGFDITVGGNTDLKGAVIASSQDAIDQGKNRLSTGTLTYSDIANNSSYDAKGISLSGGYSVGTDDDKAKAIESQTPSTTNNGSKWSWQNYNTGANGSAAGYGHESGNSQSTTHSGISGGALVITDEAGQQAKTGKSVADTLAGLKRDVVTGDGADGLTKQWDGQKLQEQVAAQAQITATFGQQAGQFVGEYATKKAEELRLAGREDEAAKWDEGGAYRVAAHTVVGLLGGQAEGAVGAAGAAIAAPALNKLTADLPDGVREAVGLAVAAGIGSVAGEGGVAAAINEDANNRLLHPAEAKTIADYSEAFARYLNDGKDPSPEQVEEAKRRLTERALYQIDSGFADNASAKSDIQAASFINTLSKRLGANVGDVGGGVLFDARGTDAFENHIINSAYIVDNISLYNGINTENLGKKYLPGYSGAYLAYANAVTDRRWAEDGTTLQQAAQLVNQGNFLKHFATNGVEAPMVGSLNGILFSNLEHAGKLDPLDGKSVLENWVITQTIVDALEGPVGVGEVGGRGRSSREPESPKDLTDSAFVGISLGKNAENPLNEPQILTNQKIGSEFERQIIDAFSHVDGIKNMDTITVTLPNGKQVTTIPDMWGRNVGGKIEVKNVIKLDMSDQLRAQLQHSKVTGEPMNIIVSDRTKRISKILQKEVRGTGGDIYVYDPKTGNLTKF
ncbi:hypothetical protein NB688_004182 [Xanthomonas sacchari]|uniref:Tox-REase-7 domain-containing protein n=1 Tax=Xanthomonas sacchari TaxID=56458 RepID=A0ABT3DWJ3_9XANT|nr:hemagglutinin repeat-containing protein [Xanthomonas sacchari]MCW0399883.1 hypothetical protein [Xanthomonas sacchari]MCW0422016.1 hypothetical protein [Xanthomonas sacchari]UYK72710.1 hemagglutinin repeat-containing protein [Xanthomonas sacchari]